MCIACSFKLWITPSEALTSSVKAAANKLKDSTERIASLAAENENLFKQLRRAKPELAKLSVQVAALREEKPTLQDLYQSKKDKISQINSSIYANTSKLLAEIDSAMQILLEIVLNSNALIMRKDKKFTKLIKNIMALKEEPKLKHELILRLNTVKENTKSTALKLLQAAKFQEKKILQIPAQKKIRAPLAERISQLGINISVLEDALAKLGIENIDKLAKDAEKEIAELKEMQLDALLLMPAFERHIIKLRKSLYLLEEDTARVLSAKLDAAEKNFNNAVSAIASSAQKLFESIRIIWESK